MKATGITAEFDPLHEGHAYFMEEARRTTCCDALAVAMSGDFVQRGAPAVTDKWTRTEAALRAGADLVIEIPVIFCLGNASQYASASVRLLEACGCSRIAFGSESGDLKNIEDAAAYMKDHRNELGEGIRALTSEGLSWPAARAKVYRELSGSDIPGTPNDILALEYVMHMKDAAPAAVRRNPAFKSASEIRSLLSEGRDAPDGWTLTFPAEWTEILRYAVMSADASELEDCPSAGEGLANLLKKSVLSEDSFDTVISSVKSRRYTYTRISRLCMQAILGITRTKYPHEAPEYIRVLGFTDKGRELLSEIKAVRGSELPVITNINREADLISVTGREMLALDIHAADIYNLVTGRDCTEESDHVRKPVMA